MPSPRTLSDSKPLTSVQSAEFPERLKTWLKGAHKIVSDYNAENFSNLTTPPFEAQTGPRFIRIVHEKSVFAFIDRTTGDVLKAAGWDSPAKHARGNLFDVSGGLSLIGPYGPKYLR